ncbi:MAG: hypothetical protein KDJ69_05980 [Nitratireductor sp.]|nr:hypothetical protein [Nitratireductor sp.]
MNSFSEDQKIQVASNLRGVLARQRLTQEGLQGLTEEKNPPGLSIATIQRAVRGEFSEKTIRILEATLEENLLDQVMLKQAVSDSRWGGYAYAAVERYIGDYLCCRRSFGNRDTVYIYHLSIDWDQENACLKYSDRNSFGGDYSQTGYVCIPPASTFLHLLTLEQGSCRLITVTHMLANMMMRGAVLTMYNPKGVVFTPACAPILIKKITEEDAASSLVGEYNKGDEQVADLVRELDEIQENELISVIRTTTG